MTPILLLFVNAFFPPFEIDCHSVVFSLQVCSPVLAQQRSGEETRPRRTQTESKAAPPNPLSQTTEQSKSATWNVKPTSITNAGAASPIPSAAEPTIRVALATDVRSASISTSAHLMSATDFAQTFVPLDVTRVRVDSHLLSPLPLNTGAETCRLKIEGLSSRSAADELAKQIHQGAEEDSQPVFDAETKTWGLLVGPRRSREDAEAAEAKLEAAGFEANIIELGPESSESSSRNPPPRSPKEVGQTPQRT
jgi:hypothetical protein